MSKKLHTRNIVGQWGGYNPMGYQWRLTAQENPDGNFRVIKQVRSGNDLSSKFLLAVSTAGILLPRIVRWRNDSVVKESVTKGEAEMILDMWDKTLNTMIFGDPPHVPNHKPQPRRMPVKR